MNKTELKKKIKAIENLPEDPERIANRILIRKLLALPMNKRMNFLRIKCGKGSSL
jgi:hypothetical protein